MSQTKDIKNFIFLEKYASGFWVHIGRCWKQLVSQTEDIKNFIFQEKHTLKSQKIQINSSFWRLIVGKICNIAYADNSTCKVYRRFLNISVKVLKGITTSSNNDLETCAQEVTKSYWIEQRYSRITVGERLWSLKVIFV